jgi:hypothetical protein
MAVVDAPRRSQYRVCYDPSFTPQSTLNTPNTSLCTAAFQIDDLDSPELRRTIDSIYDGSHQFVVNQQTITSYQRFTINFDADAQSLGFVLAGWFGGAGAPSGSGTGPFTSALSMLGICSFRMPYTTIVLQAQCATPSDPGLVLPGCAVNKVTITANAKERVRVSAEIFAGPPQAGVSFTAPNLLPINPLRLDQGVFTVDGVNRLNPNSGDMHNITHKAVLTLDNKIIDDILAFPIASIQPQLWERADERTMDLLWVPEGYLGDSLDSAATADPRTFYGSGGGAGGSAFSLQLAPLGGVNTSVAINCSYAMLTRDDKGVVFDGLARTSCLQTHLTPTLDSSSDMPLTATVVSTSSSGFLQ